jgi:kumamolisin
MMRRPITFLLTIVGVAMGATVVSQAQPQYLLTRHVRDLTLNGKVPSVGRLPATQSMRLDIVLAVRDRAALENFLQELYDPASPFYRHFLTVQQFTETFGPRQEDYDRVVSFAKANGFTVVGGSRDAMDVQLKGPVAAIEAAFHVTMGLYHDPVARRNFYAPDREPTVDLPFRLWHISGLDNYAIPRPALVRRPAGAKQLATTGSCPSQSFCGSDMRAAYYEGTALTGSGQNIGLLEFAGFDIADVNTYYTNAGQTRNFAVTGISTDGTSIDCVAPGCDDTEQTIDITQAGGMAPDVTTVYMFVGSSDSAILGSMSSFSPLPLNLSSSWYWQPPDPSTDDPFFQKMAAQGQTYFEAAGDGGAWRATNTWWPMESQYVICVGGTDLTTTGPGGAWQSETVWVDGGGGISPDAVPIPSWQQYNGVITKANEGSTTFRNGPDISANSNFTFYVCADQTTCTANLYGGTSFAAPMWAGYIALVNQQAAADGKPAPGFIDPAVYGVGLGSEYDNDFHDIISGSNGFPATPGYDLATGWGSPNQSGLINALLGTQSSFNLSVSPVTITVAKHRNGTATITSSVFGGFSSPITLSGSGLGTITFSPNPIPAGPGDATMTIAVPNKTALGSYTVTIKGTGAGQTDTTTMTVTVTK